MPSIGGAVSNDDYARAEGSASLGWSDRPSRLMRVHVRGGRNERGVPGPYGSDPLGLYGGLDVISRQRNSFTEVAATGRFGGARVQHQLLVTWADLKSHYLSPFGASDDRTRRVTGRYQIDVALPAVGLSAGWEGLSERADNTYITGELFQPVPVSRSLSGWFVEARPSLGARVALSAGVRLERIARRALEGDPNPFGPRPAFGEDVVWSASPKVAASWFLRGPDAGGWTRIRAGAGTGIKPPTAFEIAFTDNPSLRPERSRSADVGVEQALAGSALVADLTWFSNRYDDLIVAISQAWGSASRYRTDNVANARSRGLEAGLAWRASDGLAARAAWTWLDTEVLAVDRAPGRAPAPFSVGDDLVRRPRQQGSLEVSWTGPRGNAFLLVNGRGRMLDLEPNFASSLVYNPGYTMLTVGGSFRLTHGLELYARVINALDRQYEEVYGFPGLGRTAMAGVRVAAGR